MRSFLRFGFFAIGFMTCQLPAELTVKDEPLADSYAERAWRNESTKDRGVNWLWALGGGVLFGALLFQLWKRARNRRTLSVGIMGLCFFAALTSGQPARACMNVELETLEQRYVVFNDTEWFSGSIRRALAALPKDDPHAKANPNAYPSPPPPGTLENDEAVRLVLRGDVKGALVLLQQIEAKYPGLYSTAANMGSCYELSGDNESALKWIGEGIHRNPASHMVAEWLHVAVLKAKLAMQDDPNWLASHTISGLNPHDKEFVTMQGKLDRLQVLKSFRSQCTVRELFIKSHDPIMHQLLYEAATFLLDEYPHAVAETLKIAEGYGPTTADFTALRLLAEARLDELLAAERKTRIGLFLAKWKYEFIFLLTAIITFLLLVWRNQIKDAPASAKSILKRR